MRGSTLESRSINKKNIHISKVSQIPMLGIYRGNKIEMSAFHNGRADSGQHTLGQITPKIFYKLFIL
jgi:hypothetical protein